MKAIQKVTSDKSQIPTHYVQLSSFGCNSKSKPATQEYQVLHHAWSSRKLGGWKFMSTPSDQRGPIYVDPSDAEELLRAHFHEEPACDVAFEPQSPPSVGLHADSGVETLARASGISNRQVESAVIALCEINNGITLMQATLERLTSAVEGIATQPKPDPVETWRDMNGESL